MISFQFKRRESLLSLSCFCLIFRIEIEIFRDRGDDEWVKNKSCSLKIFWILQYRKICRRLFSLNVLYNHTIQWRYILKINPELKRFAIIYDKNCSISKQILSLKIIFISPWKAANFKRDIIHFYVKLQPKLPSATAQRRTVFNRNAKITGGKSPSSRFHHVSIYQLST